MDWMAILTALSEIPQAIDLAKEIYAKVQGDLSPEDDATIKAKLGIAQAADDADTAQAVADLDAAAKE